MPGLTDKNVILNIYFKNTNYAYLMSSNGDEDGDEDVDEDAACP